jgi:hypothetical protein
MPKKTIDYSKTIIYKLVHKEDYNNENIYIGSTTDFVKRKYKHKSSCNNEKIGEYNEKKYQYIRNNGGWDCFNMIEIEKYPCNDGNETRSREEYWRCHFNAQLNTIRAYRTDEQKKEQDKERYEQNKEQKKEQKKEYYERNKEQRIEQDKTRYERNKKKILEQAKERYENHKDKLSEKITCECGTVCSKSSLIAHRKSQKHLMKIGVLKYEFVDDNDDLSSTECITHQPL